MKKLFIFLVKYIPVIQMAGMLINNIFYYFNLFLSVCRILDFVLGNSIITTLLLYICSNLFGFCKWHKLLITANIINILLAGIDVLYHIPISDIELLMLYGIVDIIFLFMIIIYKFKCKH